MRNPAVFLETAGLSALPTPTGLFLPSQQPQSESPKLPALRADVSAKVRARHLGFLLLFRRSVQNPSIFPIPAFLAFAEGDFSCCRARSVPTFFQRSRTEAQRPVFWCLAGTRSAGLRKPHKPPTRARRRGSGVFAVHSTHVFNKIGIFPPCGILVQLLHLPVIVLLERELNWSDGEA